MWRSLWLCILLTPHTVTAAVTISEVAWMGSSVSANHEWIELANDGSAVDVTGWTLTDGMNLEIPLTGVIPADGVVVLERTSDESAPGSAFLIYTGALVNTGATLTLRRADGGIEDQVAGGENWDQIGGDNATKETAQYAPSGWFTAPATPGKRGAPPAATAPDTAPAAATPPPARAAEQASADARSRQTVRLTLPDVSLQLVVDAPTVAYVNQAVPFAVEPSGIGPTLIDSLRYEWNFGDTHTATGQAPTHRFLYPGMYVVTVFGGFKRQEQVARHEITILPLAVSLSLNRAGDVQVNNDSPYEINLSGYRLVGERTVTFPPHTLVLPNQTVTVAADRLGTTVGRMLALYDETAAVVATRLPTAGRSATAAVGSSESSARGGVATQAISAAATSRVSEPATVSEPPAPAEYDRQTDKVPSVGEQSATVVRGAPAMLDDRRAYTVLAVLLLLIILGIYLSPRRTETS